MSLTATPCFVCGDPTIRPEGHCSTCDPAELCEGHESLSGAHMGETVFCDGTCSQDHPANVRRRAADRLAAERRNAAAGRESLFAQPNRFEF